MNKRLDVMAFVVFLVAACGPLYSPPPGITLTDQHIDQFGARTFPKPQAKVLEAVANGLRSDGFEIAFVNTEKGLIKTQRKEMSRVATGRAYGDGVGGGTTSTTMTIVSLQFEAYVTPVGDTQTRVRLVPFQFINEQDISKQPGAWYLDGRGALKEIWEKIFHEIDIQL